jgi:hypothetical protein
MIHDYLYIKYKVSVNFKYKWYADLIYAKEMELMVRQLIQHGVGL